MKIFHCKSNCIQFISIGLKEKDGGIALDSDCVPKQLTMLKKKTRLEWTDKTKNCYFLLQPEHLALAQL